MKDKLHLMGKGLEASGTAFTALDGCPERHTGDLGPPSPLFRPSVDSMTELEYKGLMEERYGILDEGIF